MLKVKWKKDKTCINRFAIRRELQKLYFKKSNGNARNKSTWYQRLKIYLMGLEQTGFS